VCDYSNSTLSHHRDWMSLSKWLPSYPKIDSLPNQLLFALVNSEQIAIFYHNILLPSMFILLFDQQWWSQMTSMTRKKSLRNICQKNNLGQSYLMKQHFDDGEVFHLFIVKQNSNLNVCKKFCNGVVQLKNKNLHSKLI